MLTVLWSGLYKSDIGRQQRHESSPKRAIYNPSPEIIDPLSAKIHETGIKHAFYIPVSNVCNLQVLCFKSLIYSKCTTHFLSYI